MKNTKVINLFGGPGAGKSTLSAGLFYQMKLMGLNVEQSSEWIKDKLFEDTPYPFKDQLYTFAKQNKRIREKVGKVDYIICDSPLIQGLVYQLQEPESFKTVMLDYFNLYDNVNLFLERIHRYQQSGRIQSEEQATKISHKIEQTLIQYNIPYTKLNSDTSINRIIEVLDFIKERKDN